MFLRYLEPVFRPWRAIRNKQMRVRTIKGNFKSETSRVRRFKKHAVGKVGQAQDSAKKAKKGTNAMATSDPASASPAAAAAQKPAAGAPATGAPGNLPMSLPMGQQPAAPTPGAPEFVQRPPLRIKGFFWKTYWCTQCAQKMHRSWEYCPYCDEAYRPRPQAKASKTQSHDIRSIQRSGNRVMLGWVVTLNGPERGQLYTLGLQNIIGSHATCTVQLVDSNISKQHIEIVAIEGRWMLRDQGSSNGTTVNGNRVVKHDLIDNDLIEIGTHVLKFKCL